MNFVGLYAGCGGADSGFHYEGFSSLGAFDFDSTALKVYKKNLGGPIFNVDLTSFDWPSDFREKEVDVVFSGAPCQGFSTAGNRILDDPRNNLLTRGGKLAIELGAKVFVSENVMGSLSGKFKKYWNSIELVFKQNGYKTQFIKVNCLDFGMAQTRKRVLFFAWKGGCDQISLPAIGPQKTLKDVLKNLESTSNNKGLNLDINSHHYTIVKKIKANQKLCNVRGGERAIPTWEIPDVFGKVTIKEKKVLETIRTLRRKIRERDYGDADPVRIEILENELGNQVHAQLVNLIEKGFVRKINGSKYDLTNTFNGKYRRLDWNKPSPTVDTRFGEPHYFLHPDENRGFTVREAARIQGFNDNFEFEGTLKEQFRMIGNAVPPPLSRVIAKEVREQILN